MQNRLFDNHKTEKDFTKPITKTILAGLKKQKEAVNHLGIQRVSSSADSLKRSGIPLTASLHSASSEQWLLDFYERWRNEMDTRQCTAKKEPKCTA